MSQISNDNIRQGSKIVFGDDNIHSSSCVVGEKVKNLFVYMNSTLQCNKYNSISKCIMSKNLSSLQLLLNFHKLLFVLLTWILKIKIIIQHPSAKPEKVLQYSKLKLHPNYVVQSTVYYGLWRYRHSEFKRNRKLGRMHYQVSQFMSGLFI